MTDDPSQHKEYIRKGFVLRSSALEKDIPSLPDLTDTPIEYSPGSTDAARITKIKTGILEVNPDARKILYICNPEFVSSIKSFQKTDKQNWTNSVRANAVGESVNGTDSAIKQFYQGLMPLFNMIEAHYTRLNMIGKPALEDFIEFASYEDVYRNSLVQAVSDTPDLYLPSPQEASRFHWEHKWDEYLDGTITHEDTCILLQTPSEELGISRFFLSKFFAYVIDDSPSSPYTPNPFDLDKIISMYYFLRLTENAQAAGGSKKSTRIPIILNTHANTEKEDYRLLHQHVYCTENLNDSNVFAHLRKTDEEFKNVDFGMELISLFKDLVLHEREEISDELSLKKHKYREK